nr:MAG TPA: hypothetical protein [Caudoviricetes sp.]
MDLLNKVSNMEEDPDRYLPVREDLTLDNNQEYPHIDLWEPDENDPVYVRPDGKTMVVDFHRVYNIPYNVALNTFNVNRDCYAHRLDTFHSKDGSADKGICHYVNYFIHYYDDDNELLLAYLKIKTILDKKDHKVMKPKHFNRLLQHIFFTDSIIEKVKKLTDANYIINLNQDENDKKEYPKSLQFTNQHGKIMMSISFMMKIIAPVIYHYIGKHKDKETISKIQIYPFYEPLFTIIPPPNINIWNKIYITALANYNANAANNKYMWQQQEIFGVGRDIAIENLVKEKLISDNVFKYTFNKSIVNFNAVILKKQLRYYNKTDFKTDLKEIKTDTNGGNMSGKDKFEMASRKVDESFIIITKENIKLTIKKLKKELNVSYTKDEIDWYMDNFKIDNMQAELINYVFAKSFGGFNDLSLATRRDYMKLFIILKKNLIDRGFDILPYILTGNKITKLNTRTIQNNKFIQDIKDSNTWRNIINEKFSVLKYINSEETILNMISNIINSGFLYCEYEDQELNGELIEYDKYELANDILNLLWFI